jgi:ZIP family zinc transporter
LIDFFRQFHPVVQALFATLFTWAVTALGAAVVFFTKSMNQRILDAMLGFAAGAMVFVVIEELVPESQYSGNADLATIATMAGFVVMMFLDVALG